MILLDFATGSQPQNKEITFPAGPEPSFSHVAKHDFRTNSEPIPNVRNSAGSRATLLKYLACVLTTPKINAGSLMHVVGPTGG